MDDYKVLQKIGAGNFAKVYLAVHVPTGKKVSKCLDLVAYLCLGLAN